MDEQAVEAVKAERREAAVPRLAKAQRHANMAVGLLLLSYAMLLPVGSIAEQYPAAPLLVLLMYVAATVFLWVAIFRLSVALGHGPALATFFLLLSCVPLLGLILLLILNQSASARLRQVGLKIGLLGVSAAELERFESEPAHPL